MPLKDGVARKLWAKQYREANKEKASQYQKQYRATHDATEYKKEYYKTKKFSRYNITKADFENLLIEQNHCCAICNVQFTETLRPYIDHCHTTGKVRGLLCFHCNTGLGHFKDTPHVVYRALEYLEK